MITMVDLDCGISDVKDEAVKLLRALFGTLIKCADCVNTLNAAIVTEKNMRVPVISHAPFKSHSRHDSKVPTRQWNAADSRIIRLLDHWFCACARYAQRAPAIFGTVAQRAKIIFVGPLSAIIARWGCHVVLRDDVARAGDATPTPLHSTSHRAAHRRLFP